MSTKVIWSAPGSRCVAAASSPGRARCTACNCRLWPWVNERRKDVFPGRRRCPCPIEQQPHSTVPQPVDVVDFVRAGCHPRDQAHHLRRRVGPAAVGRTHDPQILTTRLGSPHRSASRTTGSSPHS